MIEKLTDEERAALRRLRAMLLERDEPELIRLVDLALKDMLDHIAADESAENDDIRRNLALVAFHLSLAAGRRSDHQETTQ